MSYAAISIKQFFRKKTTATFQIHVFHDAESKTGFVTHDIKKTK